MAATQSTQPLISADNPPSSVDANGDFQLFRNRNFIWRFVNQVDTFPGCKLHTIREAGGSRCMSPNVMISWRLVACVGLFGVAAVRWTFNSSYHALTMFGLSMCSQRLAEKKSKDVDYPSVTVFSNTFSAILSSFHAVWAVYQAIRLSRPQLLLDTLPYAVFLVDVLVKQANIRPHFSYGLKSLLFWFLYLYRKVDLYTYLVFQLVAIIMLFVTVGLTRIFDSRETPQRRETAYSSVIV